MYVFLYRNNVKCARIKSKKKKKKKKIMKNFKLTFSGIGFFKNLLLIFTIQMSNF